MKPCLKLLLSLPDSAQEAFAQRVERGLSLGASQDEAKREASRMLMDDLKAEAEMVEKALREQHPGVFAESAAGNNGQLDPENPDIRYSADNTREILGRVIDAKNKTLRRVNPASVLERDISTAAKAIEAAIPAIAGGEELRADIPIGPAPHVLHMLGAPMQSMVIHTSIVRKVLTKASQHNHADDFVDVSPREFVEAIYRPAVVLRGAKPGEWELVTNLKNASGEPIMFALMSDAQLPPLANGKRPKVLAIKTAYSRTLIGNGDTILSRIKSGRLAYAEMDKARSAFIDGWAQFQVSLAEGLRGRTVKDDLSLVKFIGDNYKPDSSPMGWDDAPAYSRDEGQFELPEFGPGSRFQLTIQDRYNRWKQAVQAVREQGGNVNEYNDFYAAEERYWGRVGAQNESFGKEVEDFVAAVKKDGLTLQDVAEYVYAKHAAERNAYVAKMRDDMEGTGSGMTDEEADSILIAAEQSGLEPLLMKHAETLYDWIDGTRQVMLENGLISEAEANSWEGMFTHYVPLRGLEGKEPQGKGTGAGFNIKGKESKQITGRRSRAKQIIEQIIQDRTKAYIRAGKNEVLRTFLNFALDNPSPNLWKVNAVETKPAVVVDEFGNRTVEQREMLVSDPRRVVSLKDGGQTIHIEVKDQELLRQLQNGYATTPIAPVAAMLWANRTVGAMLTAFSPVFVVTNAIRDAQTALFGMIGVKGYKGAGDLALQYPAAMREAFNAYFGEPSAEYREYLLAGGTTGYFGLKELDETGEELAALMRNAERSPVNPIKAGKALIKFVEDINGVVEQTTRFAAYRAAKRSGSTVAEAAGISKNLTVNFNRKGSLANFTSAAVLFFNPAVQGTARLAEAMKSPKVWGALGGAAAGVFFLALANADMGGEDDDGVSFWDKVPKEIKERNLVIMRPPVRKEDGTLESRYIKIPVAYGYNVFLVAAYEMADAIRHREDKTKGREPMESATRVATAFLSATLPVQALGQGLTDSSMLTMLPYSNAAGPVFQAFANISGFGRPLYPEDPSNKYLPDSQKYSAGQAGTIFQKAAEKLNDATGGDRFERGFIDIAPGSLENAARFYGGGLTSMTLDIMNAFYVRQHIERPEPDLKRLPFAKQFYGSINDETDRWFAYERMNKAESAAQPLEAAIRAGDAQAVESILKREPLAVAGGALDKIRKSLADIRKAELAIIQDPDLTDGERYVRLMEQSKNAREVLRQWNRIYDDLNKREEPAR